VGVDMEPMRGFLALGWVTIAPIVLAGGMATRMGGVVKALVNALPGRTSRDAACRSGC
jgi:UTP--glucose-1-phosphate uridylyltransferase